MNRDEVRWAGSGLVLLVATAAMATHATIRDEAANVTGLVLMLDHIFTLLAAGGVILLCGALGRTVLERVGWVPEQPLEGVPLAVTVGIALAGTAFLAAGAVGGLRPWGVITTTAILGLLARGRWIATFRWFADVPRDLRRALPERGPRISFQVVTGALVAFMLIQALAPPTAWDALMYHLDVPAAYLAGGWVVLPEDNLHAVYLGVEQFLYIPLLALGAPAATAVLNVFVAALLGIAVVGFSTRFFGADTGALSGIAVWGNGALVLTAITPRIDTTLAFFTFVALSVLVRGASGEVGRRGVLVAAGLLGAAVGVKLHALAYVVAVVPVLLWVAWSEPWSTSPAREIDRTNRPVRGMRTVLFMAIAGFGAGLPWLVRNYVLTGDPFFPVFSAYSVNPWLADLLGWRIAPASVDRYIFEWIALARERFNVLDAFFAPGDVTIEGEGRFYFASLLLFALPLAVLRLRSRAVSIFMLVGLGYLAVILLRDTHVNLRYLLPGLVPLTIVAMHGLLEVTRRFLPAARGGRGLPELILVVSLLPTAWMALITLLTTPDLGHALGTLSRAETLAADPRMEDVRHMINDITPPESRVLLLNEARGLRLDRNVLQDNLGQTWSLLEVAGATERCLEGTGVTHILRSTEVVAFYGQRGIDVERLGWTRFDSFAHRCLEEVAASPYHELFAVRRR